MRRLKRVLGGVLSLAVGLVGFALAQGFGEAAGEVVERYLYEPDRQEKLEVAAEGVRERLDLPKQLDRISMLRHVESGQNRLIYFYKIDPGPGRTLVDD
ncbi:hypothetical protein [Rhodovibrio sodomensis]|uniref:hypothetical protein n=1 Tax=Rhodovibrio sodomensis TaxID=1088 RepID=UPI001907AA64|nr:hypothetical protein [Rhodovibrio sodomensis]